MNSSRFWSCIRCGQWHWAKQDFCSYCGGNRRYLGALKVDLDNLYTKLKELIDNSGQ